MTQQQTFIIGGEDPARAKSTKEALRNFYGALDMKKRWRVSIEPYVRKRTTNQNSLYWQWCSLIADETGNDKDEIHEVLLAKFCPPKPVVFGDEEILRQSTRLLNTTEMKAYMDKVMAWAGRELNITLPLPEDEGVGQ